jgi:hypothetical protein
MACNGCVNFSCGLDESAFIFVAATSKTWISFGNGLGKYRQCLRLFHHVVDHPRDPTEQLNCLPLFLGCVSGMS